MSLVDRARRLRKKGDSRKAIVALREACLREEENAAIWTLYGALLAKAG
jgi:Flp pilus assembly protein TadD